MTDEIIISATIQEGALADLPHKVRTVTTAYQRRRI